MPETISFSKSKRRISGLLVLILVFIIALAAVSANTMLHRDIGKSERAEILILRLQGFAYQLSTLEWQSISEGQISSEIVEGMYNARDEIERLMGELEQLDPNSDNLRMVRQTYSAYDSALSEEFRLIEAGDIDQARFVDEEEVDPDFKVFTQALAESSAAYSAKKKQAQQLGDFGSILVVALSATAIALLFFRFQKAQAATEMANAEQLTLARHRDDFRLLNEMGNRLQTCLTVAEAYSVIANFAQRLFPNVSGVLHIVNKATGIFETAVTWGESPPLLPGFGQAVSLDKCWALHWGQVYASEDPPIHKGFCPYLEQPGLGDYLCVPMLAQGETLGILQLSRSNSLQTSVAPSADARVASKREFAETVADHIALSLTNLRLQETLRYQVIHDPLTGLFNRRYMEEIFNRELDRASRRKMTIGVMMLDIDHFKLFNDTFGHAAGDAVLIEFGTLLKGYIRGEDISCRYGGEEFLLILPDASLHDTQRRAEQLLNEIQRMSVQHKGQPLPAITVSIGIASFPEHGSTIESLLTTADSALYRAKNEGRNQSVVAQAFGSE
jgi:diguanylate cyclase (GGDEF)-like protein